MKKGHIPVRQCVACRAKRPAREMIRFKAQGNAVVVVLKKDNVPGRGCYLCPQEQCIAAALKKRSIQRALGRSSLVPPPMEECLRWLEQKGKLYDLVDR